MSKRTPTKGAAGAPQTIAERVAADTFSVMENGPEFIRSALVEVLNSAADFARVAKPTYEDADTVPLIADILRRAGDYDPIHPLTVDAKTLKADEAGHISAEIAELLDGDGGRRVESFLLLLYGLTYSPDRESLLTAAEDASLTYVTRLQKFLRQVRAERLAALRGEKGDKGK